MRYRHVDRLSVRAANQAAFLPSERCNVAWSLPSFAAVRFRPESKSLVDLRLAAYDGGEITGD
jgi:hypothetical protein